MLIDREKMLVLPFRKTRFGAGSERPLDFNLRTLGPEVLETVITGFNSDIEHEGVVYHVQTEDKGLDSPIILSLVYVGGTILASKRSPYQDLIAEGFSDEVLAERLKRQHKLICAAIHSGRLDDLKRMSGRRKDAPVQEEIVDEAPAEVEASAPATIEEPFQIEHWPISQEWTPPPPVEEGAAVEEVEPEVEVVEESAPAEETPAEELTSEVALEEGLVITLLDDEEFYSGQGYTLRVHLRNNVRGEEKPLANAVVSVKILGTTFRPLIYSVKTEIDGVATVATQIPHFTSGRAAVLISAVTKDQAAELRRIIHPAH